MENLHSSSHVYVVDSVMGSGKSSAAINYIHNSGDTKILFITPYLSEIYDRIIPQCPEKNFKTPECDEGGTKLGSLKKLLMDGCNIVSTHALFSRFDSTVIDLCRRQGYVLIMDEVADVTQIYEIAKMDAETLVERFVTKDDTGRLEWREDVEYNKGKFLCEKELCDSNALYCYGSSSLLWVIPPTVFGAFEKTYILTYMFSGQVQRCYFDYFGIEYSYLYVEQGRDGYHFTDKPSCSNPKANYRELIHIVDKPKLNAVGNDYYSLSSSWFSNEENDEQITLLKKNVYNFFNNIACEGHSVSSNNIWTVFKQVKSRLRGKGYAKGFVATNCRATNEYGNRTAVAYLVNRFPNTVVRNFFTAKGIKFDEDAFALSEMLQFIWRSAIRNNKPIDLYIPSSRMRKLLMDWVNENSA